jgi:hypothetical protein
MPFANESDPTAQAAHAHEVYMEGAEGLPVQDDLDDRVAAANASHTAKTNEQLATGLNATTTVHPWGTVKTYAGGNIVNVAANRAGIDAYPEDAQEVEDLEQEVKVKAAIAADDLFTAGGFIGDAYTGSLSNYVDGAILAEASKQTGEKFF